MDELKNIGLGQVQVQVLAMWAWDCLKVTEIADRMEMTPAAVRKCLQRATAKVEAAGYQVKQMVADKPAEIITLDSYDMDNLDPRRVRAVI